ncbi:class I SAM-dependent DNA methyltransferase [Streptantibioticus cattleyicolor]|uniref:S-adenosylmethionine (SAM)-dependent methyltransferase n=1 Tax=Streptantibioticus cattleyicolor (strain ATCC 35852 / DSM 46488 / JCM 4925 / NBRC 14057 / NRRL 8057) TaxID=1003195 RepID=F8JMI0_STREN|nr:class I SAM-dependent methyltransferase [Streptantibioticus cattleyicolor]AEW99339.1 S-adenosylmethionine (SAM)-dependent methyltransferase [Streptantibioticus cattleyicolor NRRL 8057 = DSM 46488]CCB71620.1 S-adenosylmethionine (SAM)-dependent methyltransferase [Streptantibioticus cattleyicolor NRRL 8057 = DSM 46488]
MTTTTEPYAHLAPAYDRLVDWVVTERGECPRGRIADFLAEYWGGRPRPVRTVLEVCCGTGLTLAELAGRGYAVTGLDRSAAMLEQAARRLGPDVPLVQAQLPSIPLRPGFDAVISAAAGLNYLPDETALTETLAAVARVLAPGGTFVFDLLSTTLLERSFDPAAPRVQGAELEDVSYLWTFETPPSRAHFDLTYVQFLRRPDAPGQTYVKTREVHRMYPVPQEAVRRAADRAGFTDVAVHDNYGPHRAGPETLYETWTLALPAAPAAGEHG